MEQTEDEIKVSICCLTYNHVNYIEACIEGFLIQKTNFSFEVLIHDDASVDNTSNVIKTYAKKFPSIIKPVYQKENKFSKEGGGMNIRYNFPRAKGKYIAICEGDDYWTDPLKLQKQIDFLEENKGFSYCGHNSKTYNGYSYTKSQLLPGTIKFHDIIRNNLLNTATLVFRRSAIQSSYELLKKANAGDWMLQAIALQRGKGYILEDCMSVYRIHQNSFWSSSSNKEMCEKGVQTLELMKELSSNPYTIFLINQSIKARRIKFGCIRPEDSRVGIKFFLRKLKYLFK